MNRESFEEAFGDGCGSCRGQCACGREFYNPDGGWTWEDGELELLEADWTAVALDHSVGFVSFEGKTYVADCDCWYERADKIMSYIDCHSFKIAKYLAKEKERKTQEAKLSPVVEDFLDGGDL